MFVVVFEFGCVCVRCIVWYGYVIARYGLVWFGVVCGIVLLFCALTCFDVVVFDLI